MKATMRADGTIIVTAESGAEEFALDVWMEKVIEGKVTFHVVSDARGERPTYLEAVPYPEDAEPPDKVLRNGSAMSNEAIERAMVEIAARLRREHA